MSISLNRIDHIVLTVADVESTISFYTGLLGMTVETFGESRKALVFGRQKFNLHLADGSISPRAAVPMPGSVDICLITSTPMDEVVRTLINMSVPIEIGPASRTGALGEIVSVYFRDPDRNLIELSRYVQESLNEGSATAHAKVAHDIPALPAYPVFTGTELPDPRISHYSELIGALVDIVSVEGPVTIKTVLDRYRAGCGLGKLRGPTRDALTNAMSFALTSKRIVRLTTDHGDAEADVVALPSSPPVLLRERGPRDLEEIPVNEIAALMVLLGIESGEDTEEDEEETFRRVLEVYGLKRLTETARARLSAALAMHRSRE